MISTDNKINSFKWKAEHIDWPMYYAPHDKIYRIPYKFKLTVGRIANGKVITGGLDQSLKLWDINQGKLLSEILGHRATISSLDINKQQNQMVSVDLKGNIIFTDL